jgi:2-iminobutanoate/2-iminopropanoate deaminase
MKKIIFTENAPSPIGPYSQAVLINGVLYCSGQIAIDSLGDTITVQTEKVCGNIAAVLQAAQMQFSDVVKTTCLLTDMKHFADFNTVYEKYFAHKPARSCFAAKELPKGALVEIEVIAVQNE